MAHYPDNRKQPDELDLEIGWTRFRANARGRLAIAAVVLALMAVVLALLWRGS